jgi:hypothetical protein
MVLWQHTRPFLGNLHGDTYVKIKNHHKPDASKHIHEQKSGAGPRNERNDSKIDKVTEKAVRQRDSSSNLAKVAPNERNR